MKKSSLLKLISLINAFAMVLGILYLLSNHFTEGNVKKWGFKHNTTALSSTAYITEITADKLCDTEVINEKETNKKQAR